MDNQSLSYRAEEIFRAAEMDKNGFYVVVEGVCDKPIFSELLQQLKDFGHQFRKPIIGAGGGKPNILNWLQTKPDVHVKVVLDRDFDDPEQDLLDPRIIVLDVYSIENYYFSVDVVAPMFSNLTNSTIDEVMGWLSLDDLINNWRLELRELIAVLYYYQKCYLNDKFGWGDTDIVQNREQWAICSRKVTNLKDGLIQKMGGITIQQCCEFYDSSHLYAQCFSQCFPGKLVKKSFFRYLRQHCHQNGGDFSTLSNVEHLMQSLTPRLTKNRLFREVLQRIVA